MNNAEYEQNLNLDGRFNTKRTLMDPTIVQKFFGNEVTADEACELADLYNDIINMKEAEEVLNSFVLEDGVTKEEMEGQLSDLLKKVPMIKETDIVQE